MIHRLTEAACRLCRIHLRTARFAGRVAFLAVLMAGESLATPRVVSVTASSAPIMDAAAADAQELGRAGKGTRLTATGRTSGDWLQIQAPDFISGWVYGELVRDSLIAASSVKVRSGPGIGYPDLATLTRGDAVVVRGRRGDWLEIEGQPSLLAWVERAVVAEGAAVDLTVVPKPPVSPVPVAQAARPSAVVAPEPPAPKPVPSPVEATPVVVAPPAPPVSSPPAPRPVKPVPPPVVAEPVQKPVAPAPSVVMHTPAPPAVPLTRAVPSRRAASAGMLSPVGVRLLKSAPQGEPVIVSGVLRPVGVALFPPAPYRLVAAVGNGPARTLCYVTSTEPLPPPGTSVRLQGLKYWVYGSRQPVVLVREITPFPGLTVTR